MEGKPTPPESSRAARAHIRRLPARAPALVVEILSHGTRNTDEHVKRRLFERGGVREYWLVDPERDLVTVFRRQPDSTLPAVATLAGKRGNRLTTPLLPGLTLLLSDLFAE